MASVIERNECEVCHQADGVCLCGLVKPGGAPFRVVRYTDERYLLELLKAARAVLATREWEPGDALDALTGAVLWCESDGLGPVALSGQAQLELGAATHAE